MWVDELHAASGGLEAVGACPANRATLMHFPRPMTNRRAKVAASRAVSTPPR